MELRKEKNLVKSPSNCVNCS